MILFLRESSSTSDGPSFGSDLVCGDRVQVVENGCNEGGRAE